MCVILLAIVGWYGVVRLTSPLHQIARIVDESIPLPRPKNDHTSLRIGTWNIAHARGSQESNWNSGTTDDKRAHLREIARVIQDADLDIVILNEIDFDASWSGRLNQARLIAQAAGYRWRVEQRNYDAAVPFFSLRFGNAVLSRFPIVEAHAIDFPTAHWWHPIVFGEKDGVVCSIELPGGALVEVVAVHLESAWEQEEIRNASARAIVAHIRTTTGPVIAAGDFNTAPPGFRRLPARHAKETAVSILMDELSLHTVPLDEPQLYDYTFPSDAPAHVIDWIIVPERWMIGMREVLDSQLSDHRPVIMEIEIPEELSSSTDD